MNKRSSRKGMMGVGRNVLEMSSLTLMSLLLLLLTGSLPSVYSCNRYRYYGDPCLGYEKDVCDTRRMLKCDFRTGTCQCPDFYYYFFDNYNARCFHKIGTACKETFGLGGNTEPYYDHSCPENAFCNPGSGYCECKPLFRQNYDGTGCFNGANNVPGTVSLLLLIPLTGLAFNIYDMQRLRSD